MNILDSSLEALCRDAESLMANKSVELMRRKWILTENGGAILQEFPDYEFVFGFAINNEAFQRTDVYQAMEHGLANDPVFSIAPKKAGAHGHPKALIQRFLFNAMYIKNGKIVVDPIKANNAVTYLRDCFQSQEVIHEAQARLFGVELTAPSISIADNLLLIKLTDEEVNDRQPYIEFPGLLNDSSTNLLQHHTEVRMKMRIPVDNGIEVPILSTHNAASKESSKAFDDIISTLRLCKSGNIELGPISVSSFISKFTTSKIYSLHVLHTEMRIGDSDLDSLQQAYRVIIECRSGDKVLERALHRFFLGRRRHDFIDRLIDYVIAWESLLLTVDGNAIVDELSYRFGINGASVLWASGVQKNRDASLQVMKGIYSVRSKIVHGASDNDINKILNKAGFNSIVDLVNDIEEKFRGVIFWLSSLSLNDRPYNKQGGWEQLLWGQNKNLIGY